MTQMFDDKPIQMQEAIRRRATEIFRNSGGTGGRDTENWFQAEAEILRESPAHLIRRAVVISVQGVVYTGEYESDSADGYTPGEWSGVDPIHVRLAGDKLFLRRPNGTELETTIIKRIG